MKQHPLIRDSLAQFTGHNTDEVQAAAKKLNITIMMISSGLTSIAQPAEAEINLLKLR